MQITQQPDGADTGTDMAIAPTPASTSGPQEFTLSNGVVVKMAKPKGSKMVKIFELLGPANSLNDVLESFYRTMFHITHVNGVLQTEPITKNLAQVILDQAGGDDVFYELIGLYVEHFATKVEDVRPLSTTPSA